MGPDLDATASAADAALPEGRPRTTLDLATAKLRTALVERSGYVVVTAESAQAAEALFAVVEPRLSTFRTLRTSGRDIDPEQVVRALWGQGEPPFPARMAMRTLIDEARAAALPIVVAITDADAIDPARLERVRLTLEGSPDASEIVHVALLGGPTLIDLLRRPEARGIALRIGATVQVPSIATDITPAPARPAGPGWLSLAIALSGVAIAAAWFVQSPHQPPEPSAESQSAPAAIAANPSATPPPVPEEPAAPAPLVVAAPVPPPAAIEPMAEPPRATLAPAAVGRASTAVLQVGAFTRPEGAEALRAKLATDFPTVLVSPVERAGVTYHRVRIGGFASESDVAAASRKLHAAGYAPTRVRD